MTGAPPMVLMTADAVGGVWSYAVTLCAALPDFRFVLATLGPRSTDAQRAMVDPLGNVVLAESDYRLEWMAGGEVDVAESRRWLAGLAIRHGADIVHVNGYAQARLDGAPPVLAVAHSDVLSWWHAVHRCDPPMTWSGYRQAVVEGLAAADRVVAPTHAARADLLRHYNVPLRRVDVIPNGIRGGGPSQRPKRPLILAAGRLWDDAKNLRLLDEIAPCLNWPVEIAGQPANPNSSVLRLEHARALGVLSPPEMGRKFSEAVIFAAPARYEPFGLAILEAAAASCVLVLGDIASLRENWEGAALFLPSDDAGLWRAELNRLIEDEGRREQLAAAAQARAQNFAISKTASLYRAVYRELTGSVTEQKVA
jgi:glycogen(starch) synthase